VFVSRYIPCPECGASIERQDHEQHECDPERRLDYQLFQLRGEVELLEQQVADYLGSPRGQFELWYAQRERRRRRRRS
jgi:hypothetical protein